MPAQVKASGISAVGQSTESSAMKRFKASISAAGMSFDFEICCRRIELGVVGKVWYYWMYTIKLRGGDCGNYRACVY